MQSLIDRRKAQPAFNSRLRFFLLSEAEFLYGYSKLSQLTLIFSSVWAAEFLSSRS